MTIAIPVTAPAAMAATIGEIAYPLNNQEVEGPSITFFGTAQADAGIDVIRVAIRNRTTKDWLQRDGTWAGRYVRLDVSTTPAGANAVEWSFTYAQFEAGNYGVSLIVRDGEGFVPPVKDRPWTRFVVVDTGGPPDPISEITYPVDGTLVTDNALQVAGTVEAPGGVQRIQVAIRNRDNKDWLQPDGTWAPPYQRLDAVVTIVGDTASWTFDVILAEEGRHLASLIVTDNSGTVPPVADRPLSRFTYEEAAIPDNKAPRLQTRWPFSGQVFRDGAIRFEGAAQDDIGVDGLSLQVENLATGEWLQEDGSFGSGVAAVDVILDQRGTRRSWWDLDLTLPVAGRYRASLTLSDGGENTQQRVHEFEYRPNGIPGSAPSYATLLLSRSQWTDAPSCQPGPGATTLLEVADALQTRGLAATGTVVHERQDESERRCHNRFQISSSWDDLEMLKAEYGWSFVPHHKGQLISALPYAQQVEASCGRRDALLARGFDRAWGFLAYNSNDLDMGTQADPVATCVSYGRRFGSGVNIRDQLTAPWFVHTSSANGGFCNDPTADCFAPGSPSGERRYLMPDELAARLESYPNRWTVIQTYRFVQGSRTSGSGTRYDCVDPDPARHWTSKVEVYCLNDWLAAVDTIDADMVVTDPGSVALAWGRGNPSSG